MSKNFKKLFVHQRWECVCGFEFEIEDTNPKAPIGVILGIVLRAHKKVGHKLKHTDFLHENSSSFIEERASPFLE